MVSGFSGGIAAFAEPALSAGPAWKDLSSWSVRRSARIWVGCQRDESALITGIGECSASS
jgi:hypothetical protein